jgi:hypothetical protein
MCEEEKFDQPAEEGVYVYGPYCEGCRWNTETKLLDESLPKVLFTPMPVMHFMPRERGAPSASWKEEVRDEEGNPAADGYYVAPLYNTAARCDNFPLPENDDRTCEVQRLFSRRMWRGWLHRSCCSVYAI